MIPKYLTIAFGLFVLLVIAGFGVLQIDERGERESARNSANLAQASQKVGFYPVDYVIDGDTLAISVGSVRASVRLIGVDAPETNYQEEAEPECFANEARQWLSKTLEGREVRVEIDPTQMEYDEYDRLLAYVYLDDGTLINEELIKNGYAREFTFIEPYRLQKRFQSAENTASSRELGLWSKNACN